MKNKIRIAAVILCVAVIIFEAVNIVKDKRELDSALDEYDNIRSEYALLGAENNVEEKDGYPELKVDIEGLKKKNPDITAWIYMPCLELS